MFKPKYQYWVQNSNKYQLVFKNIKSVYKVLPDNVNILKLIYLNFKLEYSSTYVVLKLYKFKKINLFILKNTKIGNKIPLNYLPVLKNIAKWIQISTP